MRGQIDTDFDAAHAVPARIEPRRVRSDPNLTVHDSHDPTADTTLCGDADSVCPLARVVVHAAGKHDGEHLPDREQVEDLLVGYGIVTNVGDRRRHHREVSTAHADGTLPEIDVEGLLGLIVYKAKVKQEMGDSPVAVPSPAFRLIHPLVQFEPPSSR